MIPTYSVCPGSWFEQTLINSTWICFPTVQMIFFLYSQVKNPPYCTPPYPQGSCFEQTWIKITEDASTQVIAFLTDWFKKRSFLNTDFPTQEINKSFYNIIVKYTIINHTNLLNWVLFQIILNKSSTADINSSEH